LKTDNNNDIIVWKLINKVDVMGKNKYPKSCDNCDNKPNLLDRLQRYIGILKTFSVALICLILSFGIVAFFIASICTHSVTMDNLNGFVSIVLGIVALTSSIVSMFLSFYSVEKAEESDKELKIMLEEMKNIQTSTQNLVSKIDQKQDRLYLDNANMNTYNTSFEADNNSWESGVRNDEM
jgi:hypothetical protein